MEMVIDSTPVQEYMVHQTEGLLVLEVRLRMPIVVRNKMTIDRWRQCYSREQTILVYTYDPETDEIIWRQWCIVKQHDVVEVDGHYNVKLELKKTRYIFSEDVNWKQEGF